MRMRPPVGSKKRQARFTIVALARAGLADDGDGRAGGNVEMKVLEHVFLPSG
jgi:hypothetical protein